MRLGTGAIAVDGAVSRPVFTSYRDAHIHDQEYQVTVTATSPDAVTNYYNVIWF
ncbi:hypothetical protein ES703_31155 [subsurface metagenome]